MNLTIELPEDLAVALQGIASDHKTSIQQLALNGLRSLASDHPALCSARTRVLSV